MPPWKAEPGYGEFEGVRRLDEESIRLIEAWVSNGMPVGQRSEEWAPPHHDGGWILGEPDLVVEMAESIEIPADGPEIFRRFRIPLGLDETKYLEALEFRPSNPAVVHHVVIVALNEGERVGGDGLGLAGDFLEAWTPGAFARPLPDGVARVLEKGARLQLQMHLRPSGKVEQERPRIGFHFAAKPPIHALSGLRLGSSRIEIPPGTQDYRVTDSVVVPADAEAIGIIPHAHYICREMSVQATPPGGEKIWLLRITDWDFNWQEHYRYASPVPLPRGTLVEMEFTYDNSSKNPRNPFEPPRKIQWGQLSSNEMAILYIEVLPKNPADLPLFKEKLRESKRRGKR
jgi:hypothetical protein